MISRSPIYQRRQKSTKAFGYPLVLGKYQAIRVGERGFLEQGDTGI